MKTSSSNRSRISALVSRPLLAAFLAGGALATWPIIEGAHAPVLAQGVAVSAEFRTALAPYGQWEHHSRWGDVWVPANRARDWRPYTVGRWAYTDDWGWYWASDDTEDAWGWIVYHYGRWVLDADFGWIWVPGNEWGPGWVEWRRGTEDIGWAPLPPDEQLEVTVRERPQEWVFVRMRDFTAPRIETVILPEREYANVIRETVVENRTVQLRDRRIAVNPGIAPDIVAAAVGRSIRSFEVRPRVLAGTARINGAIEVRADEASRARARTEFRESLRESQREIRPAASVAQPRALGRGEQGRLGDNPPRAAQAGGRGEPPATQGRGGELQQGRQGQTGQRPQGNVPGRENAQQPQPPATQGLAPRDQRQQGARPQEQRQPPGQQRQLPSTQGLSPREQRGQNPQGERPQAQPPQRPQGQQRQPPSTQGLNPREQRGQAPQGERAQAHQPPQPQRPQGQQRELPSTQGLSPRDQRGQNPQPQAQPPRPQGAIQQRQPQGARAPQAQPQQAAPRTEGLGGAARGGPGAVQEQRRPQGGQGAPGGDRRGRPQP